MYRRFIALIVAASLAVTAMGAAPAYAGDDDDIARTLAVILGAAVVGKIIYDKNKRERQKVISRRQPAPELVYAPRQRIEPLYSALRPQARPQAYEADRYRSATREAYQGTPQVEVRPLPPQVQPRPLPSNVDTKMLPAECFRSYGGRIESQQVFRSDCLERSYEFANRMPAGCLVSVNTEQGRQDAYEARCLRDAGYSLARG
ncbi:hypothetical protein SAMN04488523_103121 [Sulfitobacter brevis]|uniref:Uncharacterized protein n=1 Tax=Sulfitobacter brevis TaxID=74348 RepID=A0A1I1VY81_9RHOB|nr:hypothetical protein [Sulfitobacter brevis]SFD85993.1 hypothetical protein SAMN04488523_103121 [Sulfitobacter brevis]